jgi:hypothetical protein
MPNLRRALGLATLLFASAAATACVKTQPPGADADGGAPAPSAAASVAAAPSASSAPSSSPLPADSSAVPAGMTMFDRLALEARTRPAIHPNADDVFAAFAKVGGELGAKQQGMGATYKARFCQGGTTNDGLVSVGVCEYPDADSAKIGLQAMMDLYPVKKANHVLRKSIVLTTLKVKDGPAAQALEDKLLAAFKTL